MAVLDDIENGARKLLNAGIGLSKTIEEQVAELGTNIEKAKVDAAQAWDDLVLKGAKDNSPEAANVRAKFDEGVTAVRKMQAKVEGK